MRHYRWSLILLAFLAVYPAFAAKDKFPPIEDAHWALTEVPDEPNAPAVILFKNGSFVMEGARQGQVASQLNVTQRVKILTEQGMEEYAEYVIDHSEDLRLTNLQARTVLPGGKVIPVPEDAIFKRKSTFRSIDSDDRRGFKAYETAIAFPAVEPGAILDFSYEVRFESPWMQPWTFQSWIPTLHSEIKYLITNRYEIIALPKVMIDREIRHDVKRNQRAARELTVWMDNLPSVPDEPSSFPFNDLASSFDFTIVRDLQSAREVIFEGWSNACATMGDWFYDEAIKKGKKAKRKGLELTASLTDPTEKVRTLYEFVRDEIETVDIAGVMLADRVTADTPLDEGKGDYAEKALLLKVMLDANKIPAKLVWARSRNRGMVMEKDTSPLQFDHVLVAADVAEQRWFLDPADRDLPFGSLRYDYEGTKAVLVDPKNAELITLPVTTHDKSMRHATLDLAIDEDGRTAGTGRLELTGHHAWLRLDWKEDPAETEKAWKQWLRDGFDGFDISDIEIDEAEDNTRVEVRWKLEQEEEEVLGDEVTLALAEPFGPIDQPFKLSPAQRQTPVLLGFRDCDLIETRLSWPEGWEVDVVPEYRDLNNAAGSITTSVEVDGAARSLVYKRDLDILLTEFVGPRAYNYLRKLYTTAEKNDAQPLVLVLP